jgi:HCOMODA/2-hydroxy-3-carboxy-muconic semialdehyde decarboxylase
VDTKDELVAANRILAHFGVLDAYGHVSARHPERPDRFFISRSRSPELVDRADICELNLDGEPVDRGAPPQYLERFIHAAMFRTRPEVGAVVHSHAPEVLPFTITRAQALVPVVNAAATMGAHVGLWDIHDRFGDTNTMVTTLDQGLDLASVLAADNVVLMRGHGFTAVARTLQLVVRISVYLPLNAKVLTTALGFGDVLPLWPGEVRELNALDPNAPNMQRAWEYWCALAGVPIDRL